jgi:hypothetical protein
MNLQEFPFPKMTAIDMAFPTASTDPLLLKEAKERGFYNGHEKGNEMFNQLFYSGGQVVFKKGISEEFANDAYSYLRGFIGSWAPKHQEKEAICALILSEIAERVDPVKESKKKQ